MLKFKGILLTIAVTLSASVWADDGITEKVKRNWEESTGISKLYFGHSNTTPNIGVSHERRQGALGIDALIMSSGDNGEEDTPKANKERQILLGTSLIHHLQDNSDADVYFGSGIAAIQHIDVDVDGDEEDVTSFGPLFRLGTSYYLNHNWSVGLEYMTALNWTSDDVQREDAYGFFTLGYTY